MGCKGPLQAAWIACGDRAHVTSCRGVQESRLHAGRGLEVSGSLGERPEAFKWNQATGIRLCRAKDGTSSARAAMCEGASSSDFSLLTWTRLFALLRVGMHRKKTAPLPATSVPSHPLQLEQPGCRLGRPYVATVAKSTDLIFDAADGGVDSPAGSSKPHSPCWGCLAVECPPTRAEHAFCQR